MSDQAPLPRAIDVNVEVAVFMHETTGDTLAAVQVRATTTDGETVGFNMPAEMAIQVATILRTAGRKARRTKSLIDAGVIQR